MIPCGPALSPTPIDDHTAPCETTPRPSRPTAHKYSFHGIFLLLRTVSVEWDVEFTDEFGDWWDGLTGDEQESINVTVALLRENAGIASISRVRIGSTPSTSQH